MITAIQYFPGLADEPVWLKLLQKANTRPFTVLPKTALFTQLKLVQVHTMKKMNPFAFCQEITPRNKRVSFTLTPQPRKCLRFGQVFYYAQEQTRNLFLEKHVQSLWETSVDYAKQIRWNLIQTSYLRKHAEPKRLPVKERRKKHYIFCAVL